MSFKCKQVCIHEISCSPSSFLPAKKRGYGKDRRTDGPTDASFYRVVAHEMCEHRGKFKFKDSKALLGLSSNIEKDKKRLILRGNKANCYKSRDPSLQRQTDRPTDGQSGL